MIATQLPDLSSLPAGALGARAQTQTAQSQQLVQERAQSHIQGGPPAGFKPLTAEQAAGNILGFIERQLERDLADGATQEQLQSRLEAGMEGFEKGFNEAREKLEALGMLSDKVEADIGKTYSLVTDGVADFAEKYGLSAPDSAEPSVSVTAPKDTDELPLPQRANYEYASAQSFDFQVRTREGDTVTISAQSSRGESSSYARTEDGYRFASASVSSSEYSITIEGDLNDSERAAIDGLIANVNNLADEFFTGDLQTAFDYAKDLGYDNEQISGFALNLTRVEVQRASAAYGAGQGASDLGETLAPVGNFIRDLNNAVERASTFAEPQKLLETVSRALYGDEQTPGNRDGSKFVEFISELLNTRPAEQGPGA